MYDPAMSALEAWAVTQAQPRCLVGGHSGGSRPDTGPCFHPPEFWVLAESWVLVEHADVWLPVCGPHGSVLRSKGLPIVAFDHLRWAASVSEIPKDPDDEVVFLEETVNALWCFEEES